MIGRPDFEPRTGRPGLGAGDFGAGDFGAGDFARFISAE
jgi:hypothetical protein